MAPRDVPVGANFAGAIMEAIVNSRVFVLIWSGNTNQSEHILNELNQAFDQNKTVIPFRVENVEPSLSLKYYIGRTHWLDALTPPLEKHIAVLAEVILVNLGRKPVATPEPQPTKVEPVPVKKKALIFPVKPLIKHVPVRKVEKKEIAREFQQSSKPAWKKAYIIPVAAGLMAVTALVVMYSMGVFKGSAPAINALKTQNPLFTATAKGTSQAATVTPPPTQTARAVPIPAWVAEFSEPILAAIKDREPDFQDDFSQIQPGWQFDTGEINAECINLINTKMSIADGVMRVTTDPKCNAIVSHPGLEFSSFVLQVDIYVEDFEFFHTILHWHGRDGPEGGSTILKLEGLGNWRLGSQQGSDGIEHQSGVAPFDPLKPVTLTVISKETTYAIYLNSVPLTYFNDTKRNVGKDIDILVHGPDPTQLVTVEFDNLKVWDFDTWENSSIKVSGEDGMTQLYVPAGEFMMGSDDGDEDEKPMHSVYLDAFWIDRTEVSNQQYMECVADAACTIPSSSYSTYGMDYYDISAFKDYPVTFVSLPQAKEYCEWAGRRLPSEAEWEKAARGTDNRKFPWGNEFNSAYLNFGDKNGVEKKNLSWDDGYAATAPVGSYPMGASPYGALDMAGNVWEYVADRYDEEYYRISPQSNPAGPSAGDLLLRGGSFGDDFNFITTTYRHDVSGFKGDYAAGFRCAQSATS